MSARTYDELFEPQVRLSLVRVPGNKWIVWDQHCRFYILAPSPLEFCLRFMQTGADRGDWVIDDASVERATRDAAWQHSVRVGALSERAASSARDSVRTEMAGIATTHGSDRERPRSESVSAAPSNVIPIRRPA